MTLPRITTLACIAALCCGVARGDWDSYAWPSETSWQGGGGVSGGREVTVYVRPITVIFTNRSPASATGTNGVISIETNRNWPQIVSELDVPELVELSDTNGFVKTNVWFDVREMRQYDTFYALKERIEAANGNVSDGSETPFVWEYYRHERENLAQAKRLIVGTSPQPLCRNFTETNDPAAPLVYWDKLTILAAVGAPTNWADYTPYRALNGGGKQYGRTETIAMWIDTSSTGIVSVTNANLGFVIGGEIWGADVILTGTNNQTFSITATNPAIQSGFSTADYGWKHVANIISLLRYQPAYFGISRQRQFGAVLDRQGTEAWICDGVTNPADNWPNTIDDVYALAIAGVGIASNETWGTHEVGYAYGTSDRSSSGGYEYSKTTAAFSGPVESTLTLSFAATYPSRAARVWNKAEAIPGYAYNPYDSPYLQSNTYYEVASYTGTNTSVTLTWGSITNALPTLAAYTNCTPVDEPDCHLAGTPCVTTVAEGYAAGDIPIVFLEPAFEYRNVPRNPF